MAEDLILRRDIVLSGMKWTKEDGIEYVYLPVAGGGVTGIGYDFAQAFFEALEMKREREESFKFILAKGKDLTPVAFQLD